MTRDDRTKIYLIMAHFGALGCLCVMATFGFGLNDFIKGLSIGLMIVPLVVMLISRMRDEYIETLWQFGTSLAFVMVVCGFLVMPFLEDAYDALGGTSSGPDIPAAFSCFAAIVTFYIGFHIRWMRGLR